MTNTPLPTKPSFCYIAPISLLEKTTASTTHLVLAHLIHEINNPDPVIRQVAKDYVSFYSKLSAQGDYIICDNSAFELGESFDTDLLVEYATLIGADALVLPDYPGQSVDVTIEAAEKWIPKFKESGLDTFFVPQSTKGDLEGWIRGFEYATHNPDIDIIGWSILGIPNALPHVPPAYARVVMAHILQERGLLNANNGKRKYNHFLGLNAGPALELPTLLAMGILDSCDSSGPIWSAVNGVMYNDSCDSMMPYSKAMLPAVDFFTEVSDCDELVDHNIKMTQSIFDSNIEVSNTSQLSALEWTTNQILKVSV